MEKDAGLEYGCVQAVIIPKSHTTLTEIIPLKCAERPTDNIQQSKGKSPTPIINSWWVRGNSALLPPSSISSLIINIISLGMGKILNLIFNRIERVIWFRHLLWTLRRNDNATMSTMYDVKENTSYDVDLINEKTISWLKKHRNDYLCEECNGNATGTENSREVTEDKD